MKKIALITMMIAAAAFAGTALSTGANTDANAYWQVLGTEIGCVKDGETVYGSNDDCTMEHNTPVDISAYDGAYAVINYSQVAADANDYCELWINGDLIHAFEDQASLDFLVIPLHGYLGGTVQMTLRWVSDISGVDDGFRFDYLSIWGANNGDGTWVEVFNWITDQGETHETHDITTAADNAMAQLSYTYNTNGNTWLWYWCIDNVVVDADGDTVVNEDFETGGWDQDLHGEPGMWELDSDRMASGSQNWQCDSDAHSSDTFNAETFSPWFYVYGATAVTVDFDSLYDNFLAQDNAIFGYYYGDGSAIYEDPIDLTDWTVTDSGTNVVPSSWGSIKAMD